MKCDVFYQQLRQSRRIVFFTGAGISTESGVPDFRSPGGIWSKYQPVYFDEFLQSEDDRKRYWLMKKEAYEQYHDVKPNAGHWAIASFEKSGQLLGLITQNVDGLHQMTGLSKEKIVELHGTDREIMCLACGKRYAPEPIYARLEKSGDEISPRCDSCQGLLKLATISFGQTLDPQTLKQAHIWTEQADLFAVLGSSLQVQPAASFPVFAKQNGAFLAIINRDPTPLDDLADFVHHGEIGKFFERYGT